MDGTAVYIARCGALSREALFTRALRLVSPARREKTLRIRSEKERRLSLGAGLLFSAAFPGREAARTVSGKPYLRDGGAYFNLSHSGEFAMLAVSDRPVGCDVETARPADLPLARRFFHPQEAALLASLQGAARDALFTRLWTCKESYLKMTGQGLYTPLCSFSVGFSAAGPALRAGGIPCAFLELAVDPAAGFCLCVMGGAAPQPRLLLLDAAALLEALEADRGCLSPCPTE